MVCYICEPLSEVLFPLLEQSCQWTLSGFEEMHKICTQQKENVMKRGWLFVGKQRGRRAAANETADGTLRNRCFSWVSVEMIHGLRSDMVWGLTSYLTKHTVNQNVGRTKAWYCQKTSNTNSKTKTKIKINKSNISATPYFDFFFLNHASLNLIKYSKSLNASLTFSLTRHQGETKLIKLQVWSTVHHMHHFTLEDDSDKCNWMNQQERWKLENRILSSRWSM